MYWVRLAVISFQSVTFRPCNLFFPFKLTSRIARGRTSCHEMIAIEAISIIIIVLCVYLLSVNAVLYLSSFLVLIYMLPLFGHAVFAHFHEGNTGIWYQHVNELCTSTSRHTEIKSSPSAT